MSQTVTLRIVGDNGQLVGVIRVSKTELSGLGKAAGDAGTQARAGARGIDAVGDASERTRRRATLLGGTLRQLSGLIGGVVLVQTVRDLGRMADSYTDINGKLQQVTKSERELATARATTFKIAQETFQAWGDTVTLYQRSGQALAQYGATQATVAALTTTINQGLLVSRATAAESASAILQLSQSLGAGALRGEEFNAVNEAGPRLMQALAESMGVTRGALKGLAEEGKLTIDVLLKAWTGPEAARIAEEASKVPLTMARAWQLARNDVLKRVGEIDQGIGASSKVAGGIKNLGSYLGTLAKAAALVAVVFGGRLVSSLLESTINFVRTEVAATRMYLATMRLNTGVGAAPALLGRMSSGVRSLGGSLVSFAGGAVGIAVIAIGLLIGKLISARAEAKNLRQEVAGAIAESQNFQDTRDLGTALGAGKELLSQRQTLQDDIAKRRRALAIEQFRPSARVSGVFSGHQEELRQQEAQLTEVNRQLAINAKLINDVSTAQSLRAGASNAATLQSAEFNKQLTEQNEKLKVERIEREQGVRAALEYQAMQASGAKSVGQLSQATRDLIDMQVREISAADAYKAAQKAADDASKASTRATEEQRVSQAKYADALELATAELAGPLAQAQAEHDQRIRALDADYATHNITLGIYNGLKAIEEQKLDATSAALARNQDILGQVNLDYARSIAMSGLSAGAYRVEEELQRRLNDARAAGVPITDALTESLRAAITQGEQQLTIADVARTAAQDFQNSWLNAVDSVGRAIGDFFTGTLSSASDFGHALADIGKRWFSDLISQDFRKMMSGGFADAGSTGSGGGLLSALFGSGQGSGMLATVGRWFGFGGNNVQGAVAAGNGWTTAASAMMGGAGSLGMGGNVFTPGGAAAAMGGGGSGGLGALMQGASLFSKSGTMAKFLTSPVAPWLGAAAGAMYGYKSTDDKTGKVLAGAAYGAAGYGVMAGVGGAVSGGMFGAGMAGLAAVPVVGWIALAAIAIDKLSGGKLFGTKYKVDSTTNSFGYGDNGITDSQTINKSRQKALFGGTKRITEAGDIGDEARAAMNEAFQAINSAVTQAATNLGVSVPDLLGASFKQEFDKDGKLKTEFGTIAGQVYKEAQDAFNQRYLAENLLNVAGLAGGHAQTVNQLANAYRAAPEALTDFATLMLAIAGDAKTATLLWDDTDAALIGAVGTLESLRKTGEALATTYQRVTEGVRAYGGLMAGVRTELLTHGLSEYAQAQLQIELQYRDQTKQANALAKALGLSGARSEDLASIEQLRAQRMADLQTQMERERGNYLGDMRLSDLAPGTDKSKLADAMQQLQAAVSGGDLQRAQQLSQQALGLGRNLFSSGSDYNQLYGSVTGLLSQVNPSVDGLDDSALQQLADTMETLPTDIAAALYAFVGQQIALQPPPVPNAPTLPGPSQPINPKLMDDGIGGGDPRVIGALIDIASNTQETLRLQKRAAVRADA